MSETELDIELYERIQGMQATIAQQAETIAAKDAEIERERRRRELTRIEWSESRINRDERIEALRAQLSERDQQLAEMRVGLRTQLRLVDTANDALSASRAREEKLRTALEKIAGGACYGCTFESDIQCDHKIARAALLDSEGGKAE